MQYRISNHGTRVYSKEPRTSVSEICEANHFYLRTKCVKFRSLLIASKSECVAHRHER